MINNLFEWYRIVNLHPDNATLEARKASVNDLIKRIDDADDYDLLIDCVTAAAHGFERGFTQDSDLVGIVVECIREHQIGFPADLSENALELRACCALALGEILGRTVKGNTSDNSTLFAAILFVTARGLHDAESEKFLQSILHDLTDLARKTLQDAAVKRRLRKAIDFKRLEGIATTSDTAMSWSELWPRLKATFEQIEQQSIVDREELELLWWLYNGNSENLRQPLLELDIWVAALWCALELATRIVPPALSSMNQMVIQTTSKGWKRAELSARPLHKITEKWSPEVIIFMLPAPDDKELVSQNPSIFPISWLCSRIFESQVTTAWQDEFAAKTYLSPDKEFSAPMIAEQVFNERLTLRMY